ncbi:putative isomerase [Phytophthora citrophthora]|uniref:Isomerase n=1 Tax=Phytophthora citrophthora TaxID=4793 RepID=A0AAD9LES5_9STRA|nr:putative isomerase [Phytophthora citrophthora]
MEVVPFVQVNAFTRELSQGNPAVVVLLQPSAFHRQGASVWMQKVAHEKNLNATAFVSPRERAEGDAAYDIKWFSPLVELTMCGHGTLSSAVALLDCGQVLPTQTIRFYNRTNVLVCRYEVAPDQRVRVVLDFPVKPICRLPPGTSREVVATALGVSTTGILDIQLALNDVIVRVDKETFSTLKPDFNRLSKIYTGRFAVTTEALSDVGDFQSRFFAPRIGINEDPVTGSAHCGLGPYWSSILSKKTLVGYQSTPTRGGFIEMHLNEEYLDRVQLKCEGVVVGRGILTVL